MRVENMTTRGGMILNKTTKHSERYKILPGSMGGAGKPTISPNHKWHIVSGIDRGYGYQGYISVTYALDYEGISQEVKDNLKIFLISKGYM